MDYIPDYVKKIVEIWRFVFLKFFCMTCTAVGVPGWLSG